jgi:hypothetical protein
MDRPLERLADQIAAAREGGWAVPPEKVRAWDQLVRAAVTEAGEQWMAEPQFREHSGRSSWWCRQHFDEYLRHGLARRNRRRREWHVKASPPRGDGVREDLVVREIVGSYAGR